MWRWFKWVLLGLGIIILAIGVILYGYYIVWMKMGSSELSKAEAALKNGITITDPGNDFVMMGTDKEEVMSTDKNNSSPYSVDYLDIKSAQVGSDDKYIYFKVNYYGKFPNLPDDINGDRLIAVGNKLHIMNAEGVEQIIAGSSFGWEPVIKIPALNTNYDYCPTGIVWPENARMACRGNDSKIAGGAGTDYILGALPLEKIGLKKGQTIYFSIDEETKSNNFTHAAVDVLQGTGKMAGFITWQIGSNKYTIDNTAYQEKHAL